MKNQEGQTAPRPSTALQAPSPAPASEGHGGRVQVRRLEWWEALTPGERKLICSLMRMLRGAKRSQWQDVARAAAKWEQGIGFFIKVRLMNDRKAHVAISYRSASRSQSGVSPDRD